MTLHLGTLAKATEHTNGQRASTLACLQVHDRVANHDALLWRNSQLIGRVPDRRQAN